MAMTYLDLISKVKETTPFPSRMISRNNNNRTLARWANGKEGAIVDILGDGVYRFVDYTVEENPLSDYEYRIRIRSDEEYVREHIGPEIKKNHLGKEAELKCPIVMSGFIGFWLRKMEEIVINDDGEILYDPLPSSLELYIEYYNQCLAKFVRKHKMDTNLRNRNLKMEFLMYHYEEEKERVKKSEAVFPFLTDSDKENLIMYAEDYLAMIDDMDIADIDNDAQPKTKVPAAVELRVRMEVLSRIMREGIPGIDDKTVYEADKIRFESFILGSPLPFTKKIYYTGELLEKTHGKSVKYANEQLEALGSDIRLKCKK